MAVFIRLPDNGKLVGNGAGFARLPVESLGSNGEKDLRGLLSERPAAAPGNKGWTYWAIDDPALPGTVYVSNGTTWGVVVDLTA